MPYITETARGHFKAALAEYTKHRYSPVTAVYEYSTAHTISPLIRSQMLHLALHK